MELQDHDFGFSTVNDEAVSIHVGKLLTDDQYQNKLTGLAKLVDNLLDTLVGDPTKDNIYWPNRRAKINEWKQKINAFLEDK